MKPNTEEEILKKLHEFSEGIIGNKKTKNRKLSKPKTHEERSETQSEEYHARQNKNRKRKERRKRKLEENNSQVNEDESSSKKHSAVGDIVEMFGLNEKRTRSANDDISEEDNIQTLQSHEIVDRDELSSKTKMKKSKNKREEKEVYVFRDPRKTKKKKPVKEIEEVVEQPSTSANPIFDMDSAKFEVRKLGITGFEETKQEQSMVDLLVSLGAKPPKKKYVNYKEFQKQRKDEIIKDKEKREMDRKLGFRVNKGSHKKEKRDVNDISIRDGQVGRYDQGTQYIRKRDLKTR
ncbi:hypothetical protein SNE40_000742 [Patella caerulea]|uniref:Uncharacterized protein n=1 Tax=Patella caerulea TaxID=87958 RepID=A0AAN8KH54_PATCE